MSARQQLARLLPLGLLVLLAIAGLRGQAASLAWNGPLASNRLVIGIALEILLGVLLVVTLVRDGAARRARERTPETASYREPAGTDVPTALRSVLKWVLGAGLVAVAVAIIAGLNGHALTRPPVTTPPRSPLLPRRLPTPRPASPSSFRLPLDTILYVVLIIVLIAAVAVSIWWAARLRQAAERVPAEVIAEDSEDLRDAVESGRAALAELDDARAAIIACYVAMERSLADRGATRTAADTPDELLRRATDTGLVRGQAAGRLTGLFYEARFSTHPLGPDQRNAARAALDDLAAELAGRASADGAELAGRASPDGTGSPNGAAP